MDIFNPSRINSLKPQRLHIVTHTDVGKTSESVLTNIFPFETLYTIKQRLSLIHKGDATWLPNRVFIAEEMEKNVYRPIEFTWPFANNLTDPFELRGKPSTELFENDSRKPVFPTVLSGITLEVALPEQRTIHVWALNDILHTLRIDSSDKVTEPLVGGFIHLYFPTLPEPQIANVFVKKLSSNDSTAFEVIEMYLEGLDTRYAKLESGLASRKLASQESPSLNELRALKFILPSKEAFGHGILELKFYELNPSESLPFMRFFPKLDKTAPLIKLAKTPQGGVYIREKRVLDALMAEQPSTENGAVILIKSPIQHPRAPLGTAWTLRIFEDGSAELYIGAPRRDAPIQASVMIEALRILPNFLEKTPWKEHKGTILSEITAVFEFKSASDEGKPSRTELRKRIDAFLPMFYEEKVPAGDAAVVHLRYKSVSNFKSDSNPIESYITTLFLRDSTKSLTDAPIQTYIGALTREFGILPKEASEFIQDWINRYSEFYQTNDTFVPAHNLGAAVAIYNNHPKYLFSINGCQSMTDMIRILSLLTLFVTENSKVLGKDVGNVEPVIVPEVVPEKPVEEELAEEPDLFDDLFFGALPSSPEGEEGEEGEEAKAEDEVKQAEGEHKIDKPLTPKMLDDKEILPPMGDEWYLGQLKAHNRDLFDYKKAQANVRIKLYSRACQHNAHKQPNVLTKESYNRAKTLYGDSVFWLEAPLPATDSLAISLAAHAIKERKKEGSTQKKSTLEIVELEKRALELGFRLKGDQSVIQLVKEPSEAIVADINARIQRQKSKPLWTVVRTGTIHTSPNYYICAELWCVRDDLPIIPSEFHSTVFRNGKPKPADTCPFCGGRRIGDKKHPKAGETVIERKPTGKSEKIAKYAGFMQELYHPESHPLPCCFVNPDNLTLPEGARPNPLNKPIHNEDIVRQVEPVALEIPVPIVADTENRDRPFSSISKKGAAQNRWYIPNQNILGRTTTDWFELEKGAAGIPPAAVNELLGQAPEEFLTKNKGVLGEKINSYLTTPAKAFVRYGLGGKTREPGQNLISFIAYAQYVTEQFVSENDKSFIPSITSVIEPMKKGGEKEFQFAHAFLQANYGTLLHEFSTPGISMTNLYTDDEFKGWCRGMSFELPKQRAYAENVFMAWRNFQNYVSDKKEEKDMRLWEMIFTTPGLFTKTGFLVATITISKDGKANIECPHFGISVRAQYEKPPLLLILKDEKTGLYDPLVFYEGMTKDTKQLLGVLLYEAHPFTRLASKTREALQGFLTQYFSSTAGCGRSVSPVHPWIPVRDHRKVPRLSEFIYDTRSLDNYEIRLEALLRDRSNRLVGVIVKRKPFSTSPLAYLPCLDDGTIVPHIPTVFGEESLPYPDLNSLLDILVGKQTKVGAKRLATDSLFPGLLPRHLVYKEETYVALELECGATIPIAPLAKGADGAHIWFSKLKKRDAPIQDDLPWETDIALLQSKTETTSEIERTSEEVLNEAYQHLRITFSNYIHGKDKHIHGELGKHVKKQIELLRQTRKRLPLYELQKRLDILLTPIVSKWITTSGSSKDTVLRRDCLQIEPKSKDDCVGACSWSEGRCLIHTAAKTERYVNPVRVMTARLTDELLRTFGAAMEILSNKVSYLKPMDTRAVVSEDDALLFSATGRGSSALYEKLGYTLRKPGQFTQGLTFPEEVGVDMLETKGTLPADWDVLEPMEAPADIARDKRALLGIAVTTLYDKAAPSTFRGTEADWQALANDKNLVVLLTRWNDEKHRLEPFQRLQPPIREAGGPDPHYVILDLDGIPLQRKGTKALTSSRIELPTTIRGWLDVS